MDFLRESWLSADEPLIDIDGELAVPTYALRHARARASLLSPNVLSTPRAQFKRLSITVHTTTTYTMMRAILKWIPLRNPNKSHLRIRRGVKCAVRLMADRLLSFLQKVTDTFLSLVSPTPSVQSIGRSSEDGSSTSSSRAGPSNVHRGLAEVHDPVLTFIQPLKLGKKHADILRAHGVETEEHLDDLRALDLGTLQDVLGKALVESKQFSLLEWMKLRSAIVKRNDED